MQSRVIAASALDVGAASVSSEAHRSRNEDAFFSEPERGFFGVFDGMGGHAAADIAARLAAGEVLDVLAPLAPTAEPEAVADAIRDAFLAADSVIRTEAQSRGDPRSMGTTGLVCVIRRGKSAQLEGLCAPARRSRGAHGDESGRAWTSYIGWVGDSRALLLSAGSRSLHGLTVDDGVVRLHAASLAQARKMQAALGMATDYRDLSLRERDFFLERHVIIQALGTSLRHVHIVEHVLEAGDALLLITDGVHDNLTAREITAIVRTAPTARAAADQLVTAGRARSRDPAHFRAKPDDMTAVVIRLSGPGARSRPVPRTQMVHDAYRL